MDPDRDDQPVAQADGLPDHVQMAVGDGVEGAGIEARYGAWPRPTAPRRGPASRPVPASARFLFRTAMNQFGSARLLCKPAIVSSSGRPRNKTPAANETIFRRPRRRPETGLVTNPANETTGRTTCPMTGDRHDQGSFRHRYCCVCRYRPHPPARFCPAPSKRACRSRSPRATGSISAPSARTARSRPGRISRLPACASPAPRPMIREARLVTADRTP